MSASVQWVHCPACNREYRWEESLAGRKARCAGCRCVLRMPATPDGQPVILPDPTGTAPPAAPAPPPRESNVYDVDDPTEPSGSSTGTSVDPEAGPLPPVRQQAAPLRASPGRCPSCGLSVKTGAVICMNCGFDFRQGAAIEIQVVEAGAGDASVDEPGDGADSPAGEEAEAAQAPAAGKARGGPAGAVLASGKAAPYAHLAAQAEARKQELIDQARAHRFQDLYIPLIVVALGLGLLLIDTFVLCYIQKPLPPTTMTVPNFQTLSTQTVTIAPPPVPSPMTQRGIRIGVNAAMLTLQFPFMVVGLFMVARLFGTSFGQLHIGLLKLTAMMVCCRGIITCVDSVLTHLTEGLPVPGTWMVTSAVGFAAFWGFCSWLLEMEYVEVLALSAITFILPLIVGFIVVAMIFG